MSTRTGDLGDGDDEEIRQNPDRSLVRPALPGRKTHRSWYREAVRGRRQEANQTERESGSSHGNGESGSNSDHAGTVDFGEASRGNLRSNSGRRIQVIETANATEERDVFWEEVRSGASQTATEDPEREDEDAGEGGSGVVEVEGQRVSPELLLVVGGAADRRTNRRETNRVRCLRRRQRKRWQQQQQQQQQESQQSSTTEPSSSSSSSSSSCDDEEELVSEGLLCAVCLDLYLCPYMCHPCKHIFCEPCLRTLAKNCPSNTPCPLCRTTITHVFFQKELNQTVRSFFPKEYLSRKQNFQRASCAKWPLPSCRKLFRMFGGFPRQWSPIARRRFLPHGGAFRVDPLDPLGPLDLGELGGRRGAGWRLDMDMVIIYTPSTGSLASSFSASSATSSSRLCEEHTVDLLTGSTNASTSFVFQNEELLEPLP
ncbi:hypothetical protein NL108_011715 [Boleophthalmus pectinirostris]|nr:hypothetical protein NL108_011715 [Boleophthalmus pectinirostris]